MNESPSSAQPRPPVDSTTTAASPVIPSSEVENQPCSAEFSNNADAKLRRLDDEYNALDEAESILMSALKQARDDERALRLALSLASETPKERMERVAREKDEEAAARLSAALMASSDSDSSSFEDK